MKRSLALALGCALAITAGGVVGGCVVLDAALTVRCVDHDTQTSQLSTPSDDPATQFKIERCALDSEACTDLCNLVLERAAIAQPLTGCDVHFNGETSVTVNAHYDVQTNSPGCNGGITNGADDVGPVSGGGTVILDGGVVGVPPTSPPSADAPRSPEPTADAGSTLAF